jgi:hypothetical protein
MLGHRSASSSAPSIGKQHEEEGVKGNENIEKQN